MPAALPIAAMAFATVGGVATALGATLGIAFTIGATAVTWAAVATVTGLALTAISALAMKMPKPDSAGQQLNTKLDDKLPVPVAYGRTATGGSAIYRQSYGKKNRYLALVTALSIGPIAGIESYAASDTTLPFYGDPHTSVQTTPGVSGSKLYRNKLSQRWQRGQTPAPQTITQASGQPLPGSPGKLSGIAHAISIFDYDTDQFPQGVPASLWVLRGLTLYDPRLDSTYPGGSGPHRRDNPATWTFSENPFLAGLDWTLGRYQNGVKVHGIGARWGEVDVAAFVAGANVADANGWKVGGVVSSTDDKFAVLSTILQAGGGLPVQRGAQISVSVNAPKASTFILTTSDIIGDVEIMNSNSWRDRANSIVPTYREESQNWELYSGEELSVAQWIADDGGEKKSVEIELPLVQQAAQAHQLAAYDLCNSREFLTFNVAAKVRALNVRVGDAITFDAPELAVNGQKCLVVSREFNPADLTVHLSLKSETDSKHPYALGQSQVPPLSPALSGYDPSNPGAPDATAWSISDTVIAKAGVTIPAIVVAGEVDDPNASQIVVQYRPVGAVEWASAGDYSKSTRVIEITSVTRSTAYEIAIRYRTVRGVLSDPLILTATAGEQTIDWSAGVIVGDNRPEDGATVGAPNGTIIGDRPVETVVGIIEGTKTTVDGHAIRLNQLDQDVATAKSTAADLQATYGNTATSKANADASAQHASNAQAADQNSTATLALTKQARDDAANILAQTGTIRDEVIIAKTDAQTANSQAKGYRDQTVQAAETTEGAAARAAESDRLAAISRDQSGQSASAAGQHETNAATFANDAQRSAVTSENARLSASTAVQSMMPADFGDITNWSAEWVGASGSLADDGRFTPYSDASTGRVLQVANNPHFSPHITSKGRALLIRDHTYRVTITWKLVGQQADETPVNGALYLAAIKGVESASGMGGYNCTIAPNQAGWGSGWAVHTMDLTANALLDAGFVWGRPLFRIDKQGVFRLKSLEMRDVTGQIIAKGHADAAAESEREVAAIQTDVSQKSAAVEQNRVRAETARADAEGFRNQTAASESNVNQALSTATQQAGISASAAKTAQNRATGNIVSRGEFDAASGKGDWTGATGVYYANDIGQYILSQNDRDSYDGEPIAGNWSNRRFRVSGEVQAWGSYQAQIGIHCVNNSGANEWYIQGVASAGSWYTPFSFELLLPANVKAARAVLVSDGPSGASGHGVNWRSIRIEDITSENASKASAQASADNAAVATAKADEAGQHANASQSSQVRATTAADAVDKTFANSFPNFVGPVGKSAYVYLGDDGTGFQFDYGPGSGWPQPYITAQAGGRGGRYNRISFKESIPKSVGRRYRVRAWFYSNSTNCEIVSLWALGTDNNNWDASAVGYSSEAAPAGTVNNVAINAPGFTEFGAEFTVTDAWRPFWKPIFEFVTTGGPPNGLWHMTGLTIEDITVEKAARDSADAASSAYSNAQIEAGKAGNSATASSGSADRAEAANDNSQAAAGRSAGSAADASRDAASVANTLSLVATYSTGGGNLIYETSFAAGTAGWNFYSPSGISPFEYGVDVSGDAWRPTNEHTLVIRQTNGNATDWAQWHTDQIAVEANRWYEFSAYIAAHRCQAYIRIDWLDGSGTGIRSDYNISSNYDAEKGGTSLDGWKRCWAKVQAPSNAARAHVVLVKDPTIQSMGYGDSYAFYTHPMLRQTYAEAAGPSPYAPGNGSTTQAVQQASITQNSTSIATTNSTLANLTTVVQSGSPNLLRNGGFQAGMNYWSATHGGWNPHVSGGWGQITDRAGDWSDQHTYIDSERVPIFGGTAYTLSADSLYVLFSGSGHCYTEIVWLDGAGNWISQTSGSPNFAGHDFNTSDAGRKVHKLTATAPANATQAVARLVHYKADGSSVNVIGWRQVKFEQGSVMTAYSNEAAVTTISETVTSVDGKANQALARAAVQLDVNGYVSGWEMANNGQTGSMTINADRFQIVRPGGGPRTEYRNGLWIATDGGSWMSIWGGTPFGSGNRFMRWTGPYFSDLNNCNEANAKEYLRVDGTTYFGGALLAGTLRSTGASSATAANASTTTGAFGSNGGQVTVNTSWVYSYDVTSTYPATTQGRQQYDAALAAFGGASSSDGGLTHQGSKTETMSAAEIVLNLRKNGGLVASQGGGSKIISLDGVRPTIGDSGGRITWTYSHSSSFTHVDDERSTAARTFSADIVRNLSTGNNPSQRVSVVCVE